MSTQLSSNALSVLERRYLRRDATGQPVETVEGMFHRVAYHVAAAFCEPGTSEHEKWTKVYEDMMSSLEFLPNTPTFTGAGTPLGQLAACFVLPIDDDIGKDSEAGIFETLSKAARIQQSGGGVGFSFSRLRPRGDTVQKSAGIASGPVSFIKVYDVALASISRMQAPPAAEDLFSVVDFCIGCAPLDVQVARGPVEFMSVYNTAFDAIAQGGTRRGASMGVLRVDHPDILEFIKCKNDQSVLNCFNISVGITDKFMNTYLDEKECRSNGAFELVNPRTNAVVSTLKASEIMSQIVKYAHHNGEPGVLFLDEINRKNPLPHLYKIETTNPCGEQALGPYENCCLGSINLAKHVMWDKDGVFGQIDWLKLGDTVVNAVRFLDDVVTANRYVPSIGQLKTAAHDGRRIGLGYMGLADLLMATGCRYGARDGLEMTERITRFMHFWAMRASIELAKERGPFRKIAGSIYDQSDVKWVPPVPLYVKDNVDAIQWNIVMDGLRKYGIRNAAVTTLAPTGTIGTVSGVEGYGIEPCFALSYTRRVNNADGKQMFLKYASPLFARACAKFGVSSESDAYKKVIAAGTCKGVTASELGLPEEVFRVFVVSGDLSWEEHVEVQACAQRFLSNSVSKTLNFPRGTPPEDVLKAYIMAWKRRCCGCTVYVTGSRDAVVLEVGGKNQ